MTWLRRQEFKRAEQRFLRVHRSFLHSNSPSDIQQIVQLWQRLSRRRTRNSVSRFRFKGWLSAQSGYRLRASALARLNPEYRVRVRRHLRRDAPHQIVRDRLLTGFWVTASASKGAPPFKLLVRSSTGRTAAIPTSNEEAQRRLESIDCANTDPEIPYVGYGYIDYVDAAQGTESQFEELISRNQAAAVRVVSEPLAAHYSSVVARVLQRSPIDDHEAHKANLIAYGAESLHQEHCSRVRVNRVYLGAQKAQTDPAVTVPVERRRGSLIDYEAGQKPAMPVSQTWHVFHDVTVQGGGTVVGDGKLQVYEWAADPSWDFVSGQWTEVFGSPAQPDWALVTNRENEPTVIPEAVLLSGRNDFNWYHWMLEYLPRLMTIPESVSPEVPVLISDRVPKEGLEALRALTSRPILTTNASRAHRVEMLHVCAPPLQVLDTTTVPWADGVAVDPSPFVPYARALREAAGVAHNIEPSRLVFLSRKSAHRGLMNEAELTEVARRRGLEVLDPSELSWSEQVHLFAESRLVVGAGGAVMANYLHMTSGTRALALTSEATRGFVLPALIASLRGVRYSSVVGRPQVSRRRSASRVEWMHSDFTVRANDFRAHLDEAISTA